MPMNAEERFQQLEIRLAYQEDLISSLNKTACELQQKLDLQQEQLQLLWRQLQEARTLEITPRSLFDEIPPHY